MPALVNSVKNQKFIQDSGTLLFIAKNLRKFQIRIMETDVLLKSIAFKWWIFSLFFYTIQKLLFSEISD